MIGLVMMLFVGKAVLYRHLMGLGLSHAFSPFSFLPQILTRTFGAQRRPNCEELQQNATSQITLSDRAENTGFGSINI